MEKLFFKKLLINKIKFLIIKLIKAYFKLSLQTLELIFMLFSLLLIDVSSFLKIFLWRIRKKLLSLMKNLKDQTLFLVKVHPDQIFAPRNRVLNFGTRSLLVGYTLCVRGSLLSRNNLDKVFKNGTSKIFYRLSSTNFT